jgi:hypothetical protein
LAETGPATGLAPGGDGRAGGAAGGDVWVFVEVAGGRAAEVSLELLGRARELADRLGVGGGGRGGGAARGAGARPPRCDR